VFSSGSSVDLPVSSRNLVVSFTISKLGFHFLCESSITSPVCQSFFQLFHPKRKEISPYLSPALSARRGYVDVVDRLIAAKADVNAAAAESVLNLS
jgi:hypothetical protein